MQHFATKFIGRKILSFQSGFMLGEVTNFYMNKDKLQIEILEIKTPKSNAKKFILVSDIQSCSYLFITINSEDDIVDAKDLIRHKDLIKSKFNIFKLKVYNQDGKYLGKVKDFTTDFIDYKALKLHLKASFTKRILNESLIIDKSQVIDVNEKKIIVKNTAIKAGQKNPNILQAKAT